MSDIAFIGLFAIAAFLIAWIVNGVVGMLMGEKPQDTTSLWRDVFLRFITIEELGALGRLLNYCGSTTRTSKIVFFIGLLCVLMFLVKFLSS